MRLEAGQPSVGAPPAALEHARAVLARDPRQGYTEALGMTALRQRIAEYYDSRYGIRIGADRVAVTIGSSGGFLLALTAAFNPGDRVALAAPGYPAYRNYLKALGLVPVEIETDETTNFQPTVAHLEALDQGVEGVIVCSPSNPCGTMIAPDEMNALVRWCEARGVRIFSDEVYHGIAYEEPAQSVLRFSDRMVALNSFSKYFAMTGWRLGWLVLPADLTARVKALAENLFVSPPTLSQHVALKIFDHLDVLDGYVAGYRRNRDRLRAGLARAGIARIAPAQGAFYLYADIGHLTDDSESFCARLLDEAGVAITPGIDFDTRRGRQTVRLSYAGPEGDIAQACQRLEEWIGRQ